MKDEVFSLGKTKIRLTLGDITDAEVDAVVNAANSSLLGGGGVDGAIHRKGGPSILEECTRIRKTTWPDGLPAGEAVVTTGGKLKARNVIHTVGPIWQGGSQEEEELLASSYSNSLHLAISKKLRTIAFPSISTGAYRFPIEKASRIALKTIKRILESKDDIDEVAFYLFSEHDFCIYQAAAKEVMPH